MRFVFGSEIHSVAAGLAGMLDSEQRLPVFGNESNFGISGYWGSLGPALEG